MLGTSTCTAGEWGACIGAIFPSTEICGDEMDNDCDGSTDEGCGGDDPSGEPFPWWILILIGIVMLAVVFFLWFYFKKQGQELNWENVKNRWGSSF
jgi:hypothetical protein